MCLEIERESKLMKVQICPDLASRVCIFSKMKVERPYNPLEGFDFTLLKDPNFHEDSVREEIILPILKSLGYTASEPNKIIRSKKLLHPFVSIGSKTKEINIVPDYIFQVLGKYAWILEAKAPSEDIFKSRHVEQAYSYAIHSEIRVQYFALCNGTKFVLYHISKPEPVLDISLAALAPCWGELKKYLSPSNIFNVDASLKKDFGLHLKRLGFHEFASIIIPDVPLTHIARLDQNHYTFSAAPKTEEDTYVATFDFDARIMVQLHGKIPEKFFQLFSQPPFDEIRNAVFADAIYRITVDCRVGEKLQENKDEIFLPLSLNRIVD